MIWYVDTTLYSNLDLSKESKIDEEFGKIMTCLEQKIYVL